MEKRSLTERHALLDVSISQNHSAGILTTEKKKEADEITVSARAAGFFHYD
jgi:hypothetical protein